MKIKLADPEYNQPGTVDMLLGVEVFFDILKQDKCMVSDPVTFRDTVFGCILTDQIIMYQSNQQERVSKPVMCRFSALSLFSSTSRTIQSKEEEVERHFQATMTRNDDGWFVVRLPLKASPRVIGDSMAMAKMRFFNLENKLSKNLALSQQYDAFMSKYLTLGHMERVDREANTSVNYDLPYHAVIKENSLTTKLRVVFDASALGKSKMSLNDIMMKGPTVQPCLSSILLRF